MEQRPDDIDVCVQKAEGLFSTLKRSKTARARETEKLEMRR